ncbi:sensor histidine kinase [Psychrobacter sp. I-STPA6b]|uniref:sensor histidine kinase n=1 Tax=Psychrobacter sp. I-STPA6b TaxID=2585718 RepID=UPI001D0CA55A|nr:ATP-binding protein [Psychrobacter sp. I-STPA6b]
MNWNTLKHYIRPIVRPTIQQTALLPTTQLRKLGLIYSIYRFVISLFLFLSNYALIFEDDKIAIVLPSFLQQTILLFYCIFSIILLGLFFFNPHASRRQLSVGLVVDVVVLSLLLYTNGTPDLQTTMLYMVVVAASFMLLPTYQGIIVTLLAIIFVIYQQFFYAITNSMSLSNFGDALLLSLSFLGVGFISWSISKRLALVEQIAAAHAIEVEKLHAVNQEVISKMSSGVMVFDQQKQVVLCNEAAVYLLNIVPNLTLALTGKELHDFIGHKITTQHPELQQWIDTASRLNRSQWVYHLTDPSTVTDKLRLSATQLQDASLLILIEDMRREQTNAQQLKLASLGQLTASIAHEIRNPLAAISQASEMLIEDAQESLDNSNSLASNENLSKEYHALLQKNQGNAELYQMIFKQTKRVNRIIEDILKLSRQTKPDQTDFAIIPWLQEFLNDHYQQHDVFLTAKCDTHIYFDPHQLEQILINLINNGLRFSSKSHSHAYVELEVSCIENDVIIDVLDDGAGVNESQLPNLFHPFFTTDNEGTGLGLYLSQAFSEANHARLVYIPEHEKTCFRLIMPQVSNMTCQHLSSNKPANSK